MELHSWARVLPVVLLPFLTAAGPAGAEARAGETGMLYVRSDPPGAMVVIDGKQCGRTPVLVKGLAPGEVTVVLGIAGAKPVAKRVTVEAKKVAKIDVHIDLPTATLTVLSDPLEATVFLDHRDVGRTPITLEKLAAGRHRLLLLKTGCPRTVRDIVLKAGAEVTIDVKLGTAQEVETEAPGRPEKSRPGREAPGKEEVKPAADPFGRLVGLLRSPGERAAKAKACREHLAKLPKGKHRAEVEALAKVFSARSEDETIVAWADYCMAFTDGLLHKEATSALRRSGDALRARIKLALAAAEEERAAKLARAYLAALPRDEGAAEISSLLGILKAAPGAARARLVQRHLRAYPRGTFTETLEGMLAAWRNREEGEAFRRLKGRFTATRSRSDLLRAVEGFLRDHGRGPHGNEVGAVRSMLALESTRARLAAARKYVRSYPGGAFVGAVRGLEAEFSRARGEDLYRAAKRRAADAHATFAARLASFRAYLAEFPKGAHADEVRSLAERTEALAREEKAALERLEARLAGLASPREAVALCDEFLRKYAGGVGALRVRTRREELQSRVEERAEPILLCTPRRLSATVTKGETAALRLTILNAGGRTLDWSIRSSPYWAEIDHRAGSLGHRERRTLAIAVGSSLFPAGETRGEIVVEARGAAGSPVTVLVAVEVGSRRKARPRPPAPPREPTRRAGHERPTRGGRPGAMYALLQFSPYVGHFGAVSDGDRADSGIGVGAVFGYRIPAGEARTLGFELSYDASSHGNANSAVDARATRAALGMRMNFRADEKVQPFGLAGGGLYALDFDGLDPEFDISGPGFYLGGGVDFAASGKLTVRAELAFHIWAAEDGTGSGGTSEILALGLGVAASF